MLNYKEKKRKIVLLKNDEYLYNDVFIRIKKDLKFKIIKKKDFIIIENKKLNISLIVEKNNNIIENILNELIFIWNTYAIEDDNLLTKDAIKLKNIALNYYFIMKGV
jgi:hypothetical protein